MTLTLITGRRGSGRTRALYARIFELAGKDGGPLCLLLPEQATFLHEKQLELWRGERSLWNLGITSFSHLAQSYMFRTVLDGLGRELLVYRVLRAQRDEFLSFRPRELNAGIVESARAVLDEALANDITREELQTLVDRLEARGDCSELVAKIHDIGILLEAAADNGTAAVYEGRLLADFAVMIEQNRLLADTSFFLDDFYDFTALEYRIIEALLKVGASLTITLTADENEPLLAKSNQCARRLRRLASRVGTTVQWQQLDRSDQGDDALLYLEDHYGDDRPAAFQGNSSALSVLHAKDAEAETEILARAICTLREQGFDESEIVVVCRDDTPYREHIRKIFPRYRIDFYLDDPATLQSSPVFQYVAAFLRLLLSRWSFAALFTLLKRGFAPLTDEECDSFENYCLAHALQGHRFYQEADWLYQDKNEDVETINELRRRVRDFLLPLVEAMEQAVTVRQRCVVLWDLLQASDVAAKLSDWQRRERDGQHWLKAAELETSLPRLVELLEQMVAAFGDEPISLEEFDDLLNMGAGAQKLQTIPPSLHEVEISVLGQGRTMRSRAQLVIGLNEGIFPAIFSGEGFLNERDRSILAQESECWPQDKEFFFATEDMLTYQALTGATERLILLYHDSDGEGLAASSSVILYRLHQLFPNLRETTPSTYQGLFMAPELLLSALPLWSREYGMEPLRDTIDCLFAAGCGQRLQRSLDSLDYTGQSQTLSAAARKHYLRNQLNLSVSALDCYNRCPFSYFARYGLQLEKRKELEFRAPDLGNFFHEALRLLLQRMKEQNVPWRELDQAGPALVRDITAELLPKFGEDNLFTPEQMAFMIRRLGENLLFILDVMVRSQERGDCFEPVLCEVSFGPGGELQPLRISLKEGEVVLRGQIDRVDEAETGGRRFFRIIDYKSGEQELRLDELYYGMKIQLLLYMMIVENDLACQGQENVEGAGAFYFSLKDILSDDTGNEDEIQADLIKKTAMRGFIFGGETERSLYGKSGASAILSDRECHLICERLREMIRAAGEEIYAGVTTICPYHYGNRTSCDFCDYHTLCGYDSKLQGEPRYYAKRNNRAMKQVLAGEGGKDDEL